MVKPTKNVGVKPGHAALNLGLSTASITNSVVHIAGASVIHEGWVLKKRRKKMQGFARRYFTLYQSGLLSYAFEPGQPIRDQVYLHNAAISTAPGRKDIHIDSNTATFHIKCLSTDDFNSWMTAFRKFISVGLEAKKTATYRHTARQASINLNRSGALVEEMGNSFDELENAIAGFCIDFCSPKSTSLNKKSEKHHGKEMMFGLFKKSHQQHGVQDPAASQENVQPLPDALQDIRAKFDALKSQYSALVKIMQTSLVDASQRTSPLPFTPEEDSRLDQASQMASPPPRSSYRNSMATTASGSLAEWFDAEDDGPQEFVMDLGHEMSEPGSRLLPPDEESNPDNDRSSEDTDFE